MHDHVNHAALANFAAEKVNVPSADAGKRRAQVNHLRARLEHYIAEHPDYDLVKMRASGSVAKHTAIRGSSDTDVAAYVRASAVGGVTAEESQLLQWLCDRCKEVYGATKDADDFVVSRHAVGITMHGSGLKIDVAPVLYEGEPDDRGHLITASGERVTTSVTQHLEFLNTRKNAAGSTYKEFIRLVKKFIDRAKKDTAAVGPEMRFKSFMAELIVAHLWDSGWHGEPFAVTDYPRAFEQFLGYIVTTELKDPIVFSDYYSPAEIAASSAPIRIWDPVNPNNNVAASYTDQDRLRLVDRCTDALDKISWAAAAPFKGDAVDAWRTVFGPTFSVA